VTRRKMLTALMSATTAAAGTIIVRKVSAADPQDKLTLADGNVRELLLLMDADHNGKISKHEWMSFMEAEFNKLDKDGNGELDAKELQHSTLSARRSN
jgi:Ca2+-binding EF-hand superfamily protein